MGRYRGIILLLIAASTLSCHVRPREVLSRREMIDVLVDIHKTDGIVIVNNQNYGHDAETAAYYSWVLKKHHVTQAQFDSSLVWYTDNPQRFDKIYPKVISRLEQENAELIALYGDASDATKFIPPLPRHIDSLFCPALFPPDIWLLPELSDYAAKEAKLPKDI